MTKYKLNIVDPDDATRFIEERSTTIPPIVGAHITIKRRKYVITELTPEPDIHKDGEQEILVRIQQQKYPRTQFIRGV